MNNKHSNKDYLKADTNDKCYNDEILDDTVITCK